MRARQLILQTGAGAIMIPKMSAHAGQAVALAPEPPSPNGTALLYKPISSVWEGSDSGLIEVMLNFYPTVPP